MNGPAVCASGAGAGSEATEPRSRAPPGLGAQRRFIPSPGRNGAQRSGGPRRRRGWRTEHVWDNAPSQREEYYLNLARPPCAVRPAPPPGFKRRARGRLPLQAPARSDRRERRREGYPPGGSRPRSGLGRVARPRSGSPNLLFERCAGPPRPYPNNGWLRSRCSATSRMRERSCTRTKPRGSSHKCTT